MDYADDRGEKPKGDSDVVELIIAVDLDPSDPSEPINVGDVKVNPKGEGGSEGGEDWQGLLMDLMEAEGISDGPVSYQEAMDLVKNREPRKVEDDPFAKAQMKEEVAGPSPDKGEGFMAAADKALRPDEEDDEKKEKY